jgi:iron complex outermembrane receptor protein
MLKYLCFFILSLVAVLGAAPGEQDGDILLTGVIIDSLSGDPVVGAYVTVNELELNTVTDEDGAFHFHLAEGRYTIATSHVLYYNWSRSVDLSGKVSSKLLILLRRSELMLDRVVVDASRSESITEKLGERLTDMDAAEISRRYGMTLAATMAHKPGVSMRSMGPAPARPVIHGMSGDRVRILQDEEELDDLSASSPDHAVTIEMSNTERVEILRGPKQLLYSPSAYGSVVNVVKNIIPDHLPKTLYGELSLYGQSSNTTRKGAGFIGIPYDWFALQSGFSHLASDDVESPVGTLPNSFVNLTSFHTGGSAFYGNGVVGLGLDLYNSDYGIPGGFVGGHANGVNIAMERRLYKILWLHQFADKALVKQQRVKLSRTYYRHFEREKRSDGRTFIGIEFLNRSYKAETELEMQFARNQRPSIFKISGELRSRDVGGYVFSPNIDYSSYSAAYYHPYRLDNWELSAAVRFDGRYYTPFDGVNISDKRYITNRDFNAVSWNLSASYKWTANLTQGINTGFSNRIPTVEEIYSNGPHLAAYSYEIGNPELDLEKGYIFETFMMFETPVMHTILNAYYYDFSSYLIARNTGDINYAQLLPEYQYTSVPAQLVGVEMGLDWYLNSFISMKLDASLVRGIVKNGGGDLPMIPPDRIQLHLKTHFDNMFISVSVQRVFKQDRLGDFETETDGYLLAGLEISNDWFFRQQRHRLTIAVENLTNQTYYNHLSRIKTIMPEMRRNYKLNYSWFF